jgi:hypothetical protein
MDTRGVQDLLSLVRVANGLWTGVVGSEPAQAFQNLGLDDVQNLRMLSTRLSEILEPHSRGSDMAVGREQVRGPSRGALAGVDTHAQSGSSCPRALVSPSLCRAILTVWVLPQGEDAATPMSLGFGAGATLGKRQGSWTASSSGSPPPSPGGFFAQSPSSEGSYFPQSSSAAASAAGELSSSSSSSSLAPVLKRPAVPVFTGDGRARPGLSLAGVGSRARICIDDLPEPALLRVFEMLWPGRPGFGELDGRKLIGNVALVCRAWRDLARSDEIWRPLCITRWPWLKSLKGGPTELLPTLAEQANGGSGGSGSGQGKGAAAGPGQSQQRVGGQLGVWREFCMRRGRCMQRAGIGRRADWAADYILSVEIFDRKGGFRLFSSYGRMAIAEQQFGSTGLWYTRVAITGFASCWHFSAASRDPTETRFPTIKSYFERSHEKALEHCLCTEVTIMDRNTGKMALLYASAKEMKRKVKEKGGVVLVEEELRDCEPTVGGISFQAASGMAISKVLAQGADPAAPATEESELTQKWRVDRLYLIFSTKRRWHVNRIINSLDWA